MESQVLLQEKPGRTTLSQVAKDPTETEHCNDLDKVVYTIPMVWPVSLLIAVWVFRLDQLKTTGIPKEDSTSKLRPRFRSGSSRGFLVLGWGLHLIFKTARHYSWMRRMNQAILNPLLQQ